MIKVLYNDNHDLSAHFKLSEFVSSVTATARGIDNSPTYKAVLCLSTLVARVLEPLRVMVGRPIVISSGYRCPELNKAVGGVATSQHLKGEAADIVCKDKDDALYLLAAVEKSAVSFDQVIVEHDRAFNYWLHVSCKLDKRDDRKEVITDLLKK